MATFSKKSYSRFQGMIGDDTSDDGDAISDARYKQYIQIIYTPVSLWFWLSLHVVKPKGPFKKHSVLSLRGHQTPEESEFPNAFIRGYGPSGQSLFR